MSDDRTAPRISVKFTGFCERDSIAAECDIIDISPRGIGIRVNSLLLTGDIVIIILDNHRLPAKVIRANGNLFGLLFRDLTDEQFDYVKWLCRKKGSKSTAAPLNIHNDNKTKIYVLKAKSKKDEGLLGLFIAALRKNCSGFVKAAMAQNGAYEVEIYDSPSSVASFESLSMFWKTGNLIVK
jgi:hypothetical protein